MRLLPETGKKAYFPAKLNQLTQDQANLILIGHASCGDEGAKDLLVVLYPLREADCSRAVPEYFEEDAPAQVTSRMPWLVRRALTVLRYKRDDFVRFVRG